jgi:ornithine cyclodeaminase/alanine dehydrogenase
MVSHSDGFLYLSRSDVEKMDIPMKQVIKLVENAFLEKSAGRVEVPPKPGIHPKKDAFIHAMLAYIPKWKSAGIKWVSGFPQNPRKGLPYISGLIVLNDVDTGFPICVMDCTWITAKRTGAATAVAAKYLANKNSRALAILGCGVQGRSNLEALLVVCKNLEEVNAFDINKSNLQKYVAEMTAKHKINVTPVFTPREAVEDCDIAISAGPILKHPKPVIEASWFKDGGFACSLDFDSYWKPEAMFSMDKLCTDDREQLVYYKAQGYFAKVSIVYADLGEIVGGKKPGRENPEERIMCMNLGLAIEDMAAATFVYEEAVKRGIGTKLPL